MHGGAIVPHHDITASPLVQITGARCGRELHQLVDQLFSLGRLHALDRIRMRGEIDRATAVDRIFPYHAPALRRQSRSFLGAGKVRRDLAA
jgi:hypothetical protein